MKRIIILLSSLIVTLITTESIAMLRALTHRSHNAKIPARRFLCTSYKDESYSAIKEFTALKTSLDNKVVALTKNIEDLRSLKNKQKAIDPECMHWLNWSQRQSLYKKLADSTLALEKRIINLSIAKDELTEMYVAVQRLDVQVIRTLHAKNEEIKMKNKKIQELEYEINKISKS